MPAGERADLGEEDLAGDRDAGHVLELVGDHDQGHARHVADQDGPRSRSATKPSRSSQAATAITPTSRASVLASSAYRAGSPAASGLMATRRHQRGRRLGPMDSDLDEPNST